MTDGHDETTIETRSCPTFVGRDCRIAESRGAGEASDSVANRAGVA